MFIVSRDGHKVMMDMNMNAGDDRLAPPHILTYPN